jgi:hypothetical protein
MSWKSTVDEITAIKGQLYGRIISELLSFYCSYLIEAVVASDKRGHLHHAQFEPV